MHTVIDLIIPEVASPKTLPDPAYRFYSMMSTSRTPYVTLGMGMGSFLGLCQPDDTDNVRRIH
jgi:hypothetical protein